MKRRSRHPVRAFFVRCRKQFLRCKKVLLKRSARRRRTLFRLPRNEIVLLRGRQALALLLAALLIIPGWFYRPEAAQAATYTFLQTDWSGGADTVTNANHTSNRTGWTKFYSTDANIDTSGGTLKLTTTSSSATTTKYLFSDTSTGATSTLVYAGAQGTGSGVTLCTYDHGGADWTPTDNDAYDLNGATAGVYIAGVHCNVGTFTVPAGTTNVYAYDGSKYGLLTVFAKTVTVTGTLSAVGAGYLAATGPGAGLSFGSGCLGDGTGAAYGGYGGYSDSSFYYNSNVYGRTVDPYHMGSGGGNSSCASGGSGGGLVRIFASGAIAVNGTINVSGNGGSNNNGSSGGGSGGAIYLAGASVSGAGSLTANGGAGASGGGGVSGSGGGGIVAVHYNSSTYSGTVSVAAGSGSYAGLPGSAVFVDDDDSTLLVSPGPFRFTNYNGASYSYTTVTVTNSQTARGTLGEPITITAGTLTIDSGASLSMDAVGYGPGLGPSGGAAKSGSGAAGGGGHGGAGGTADSAGGSASGDSASAPTQMGSGGGTANTSQIGGNGGGYLRAIVSGTATVNGTLSANGGGGAWDGSSAGGGGAGGTIYLTAATIAGNGSITARGGNGGNSGLNGGGGGGGVVSLHYGTSYTFSGTITVTKGSGGTGAGNGVSNSYNDLAMAASPLALMPQSSVLTNRDIAQQVSSPHDVGRSEERIARESLPAPPGVESVRAFVGTLVLKTLAPFTPETAYAASGSGTFESATIDLSSASVTFNQLTVASSTPTGTTIQIQLATSDTGSSWSYVGPDGTASTYFTKAITAIPSGLNNKRYLRYKATLTATETLADVPMLTSVAFSYTTNGYPSERTLTSTPFNTEDSSNVLSAISWSATTPLDSVVKFQLRTAPNSAGSPGTWTSFLGPDGTSGSYFTSAAGSDAMPAAFTSGGNDEWVQYKVFLDAAAAGADTPILSDVTLTYVVNAPPEFNTSYPSAGGTGTQALQVATTTDSNWGKVKIDYSVRDPDTSTGTTNAGKVAPSFAYDTGDGLGWRSISSSYLSTNATSLQDVSNVTFVTYTAYWDAKTQVPNVATSSLRIKVTANDNEAANSTASAITATTSLDTLPPAVQTFTYDAGARTIALHATDTPNNLSYELSNNADFSADGLNGSSGSYQAVGASTASTTLSWTGTNASSSQTIYLSLRDGYSTTTTSLVAPTPPINFDIKDTSNTTSGDYRLFLSWGVYTPIGSAAFGAYEVARSTDGSTFVDLTTISSVGTNYYSDQNLATTTTYYYKVRIRDSDGDRSAWTAIKSETPNGVTAAELDTTAPTISSVATSSIRSSSVAVTFTTDELASSTIEYSTALLGDFSSTKADDSYALSHSVSLTGLTPNTAYVFRVKAADPSGNVRTASPYTFTTASGPVISGVGMTTVSDAAATIGWTTSTASDSYVLYATTTAALVAGTGTTVGSAVLTSGAHSVSLSGLAGRTTYYYAVRSTDADGNQTLDTNNGSYYTFATTYDQTPPVITNLAAPVKTIDSAVLTWSTDELANSQVEYGTVSGTYTTLSSLNTTLTIAHSLTVASLSANTKYYYRVISSDSSGNQATSTESDFTTPVDVSATTITNTIVVPLSGGVGNGGGGTVSQAAYDDVVAARNTATKERDELRLKVDMTPPTIASSSIAVIDITPFTANITFTTSEPTFAFVAYGDDPKNQNRVAGDQNFVADHKIALSGLRFGTQYTYTIKAIDKGSNSVEMGPRTFSTKYAAESLGELSALDKIDNLGSFQDKLENLIDSLTPTFVPPFVADVAVSDITENAATVSWTTNSKTFGSVLYGKESDYHASSSAPYPANVSDTDPKGQTHSVHLTNLEPLTPYHYAVTAFAIFGVNRQTSDATFTTRAPKVLPDIGSVTTDGFTAFWKTTTPASSIVEYKNLKTGEVGKTGREDIATAHTVAVEHLAPNTSYEVKIYGFTSGGSRIDAAQTLTVRTKLDNTPPSILNLSVSNAFIPNRTDRLQTVVTWRTDEPATGAIQYGEGAAASTPLSLQASEGDKLSTEHAIILTSLKPATLYRFQMSSADAAGNKDETSVKTILTPRESESVIGVIVKNFEDTFGFLSGKK